MVFSKQPKLGLTQELSFSRISESTTRYTFTPCVGSFISPGIDTRQKGPPDFSVSSKRHRQMWGEGNCLSFETAVGGIEPSSPRLTVRRSTARPPLPTMLDCNSSSEMVQRLELRTLKVLEIPGSNAGLPCKTLGKCFHSPVPQFSQLYE